MHIKTDQSEALKGQEKNCDAAKLLEYALERTGLEFLSNLESHEPCTSK